jgi:monofunctional biosynthetic peptidoglycan transglycosylase
MLGNIITFQGTKWSWRSIDNISPNLAKAIISAEDGKFCKHGGVDWKALGKSYERFEKKGKMKHGASTVAMQVSKNLYYWYLPTIIRKPLEIPTALWIDLLWSKHRVIEVYMNVAQFGPNIYGAEAAAQYYYKKPAKKLSMSEAARLASILPNPEKRNPTKLSGKVEKYASNIRTRTQKSKSYTSCIDE